ncbi:hypothetical protein LNTAR_19517 [Lentisphaera araneosa HTCC2155]|jgi:type II secretory pathway pseudopilin PulG|uniref:Uncharacterized protein n=1 Tax=Lentisphaera araneosa HTCC2155 TaxID=313628 RepID=A6DQW9_9BACT|nr:hypothetical protein [Lentisphaera araneosa]EDM26019.1 hypothetical protein LNTAR_19517 [Lentisphaera araneosa HTCC2155]
MKKQPLSLIEFMVVLAIIAILLSLLFPVLARARKTARNTSCVNNLSQITKGAIAYTMDNDNKFWKRGQDRKPTHIGRSGNGGKHEFNIFETYVTRELYSCPLAPEALDFDYVENENSEFTEAQYHLLWDQDSDPAYESRSFSKLTQNSFTNIVDTTTPKQFQVLAMDYISEKQGGTFESSHENGQPDDFGDGRQYFRRRGGRGGRNAIHRTNYAFVDGAVLIYKNIYWKDPRFHWVNVTTAVDGYKAPMPSMD